MDSFDNNDLGSLIGKETAVQIEGLADEKSNEENNKSFPLTEVSGNKQNFSEIRNGLVKNHYEGASSLLQRLLQLNKRTSDELVNALIVEMIKESDHLLGNELVATQDGDLRISSIISGKRADLLEKAVKTIQKKKETDSLSNLDLDSPMMKVVLVHFVDKVNEAFSEIDLGKEQRDTFFRVFPQRMKNWKKEVQTRIDDISASEVSKK